MECIGQVHELRRAEHGGRPGWIRHREVVWKPIALKRQGRARSTSSRFAAFVRSAASRRSGASTCAHATQAAAAASSRRLRREHDATNVGNTDIRRSGDVVVSRIPPTVGETDAERGGNPDTNVSSVHVHLREHASQRISESPSDCRGGQCTQSSSSHSAFTRHSTCSAPISYSTAPSPRSASLTVR